MHAVIFEGWNWASMAPVSLSRPVFCLASGTGTLLLRQIRELRPTRVTLWVRPGLAEYCRREVLPTLGVPGAVNVPLDDEIAVLVNAGAVGCGRVVNEAHVVGEGDIVGRAVVRMAGLSHEDALNRTERWRRVLELPRREDGGVRVAQYPWGLIGWNKELLAADFAAVGERPSEKLAGPFHLVNEANVWVARGVRIEPGAVLDASGGPVMLDVECSIGANVVIKGPVYIGRGGQIKPLAVVHAGTTIGPGCKIGGEVNNSIFVANSNKAHDGYVGDSYLGEWVNLGAGTSTSNLKNTYGEITVKVGSREIETGRRNLGSLIGDHSKTAIGTRLMTGSYVGYCSMIATSALPPTFVPSFAFLTDRGSAPYREDKALEVMRAVLARRERVLQPGDEAVVRFAREAAAGVEK